MLWIIYKKFLKILAKHVPIYQLRAFLFRRAGYKIGRKVFIGEDLIIIDELRDRGLISIGDRVAIAPRVTLVISSTPNFSRVSSHAPLEHGPIHIKNDAWLGTGVVVFPNVTIGEGAIIGAGSIVNRDIPPFCIAAGAPAKVIRKMNGTNEKAKDISAKS